MDIEFDAAKQPLRKFRPDPATARVPSEDEGQAVGTLDRARISVRAALTCPEGENVTCLHAVAPPSDAAKRAALVRRVLESNAAAPANAAFGRTRERSATVRERSASGPAAEDVEQTVRHLAAVSRAFDDRFEREFGAAKA